MKLLFSAVTVAVLVGCASQSLPLHSMPAGKFVTFACTDGKVFSARAADDGSSVRVRAMQGSAELDRQADGSYAGDGYKLTVQGGDAVSLTYEGKLQGKDCRASA